MACALRSIVALPPPLLVHCAAGRDRTGVVVALLMLLAGNDKESVVRSYMESKQGAREEDIKDLVTTVCGWGGQATSEESIYSFLCSCGLLDNEYVDLKRWLGAFD